MFQIVYHHTPPTRLITQARLQQVYNYTFISKIIYSIGRGKFRQKHNYNMAKIMLL